MLSVIRPRASIFSYLLILTQRIVTKCPRLKMRTRSPYNKCGLGSRTSKLLGLRAVGYVMRGRPPSGSDTSSGLRPWPSSRCLLQHAWPKKGCRIIFTRCTLSSNPCSPRIPSALFALASPARIDITRALVTVARVAAAKADGCTLGLIGCAGRVLRQGTHNCR